jgi:hypothetical protein
MISKEPVSLEINGLNTGFPTYTLPFSGCSKMAISCVCMASWTIWLNSKSFVVKNWAPWSNENVGWILVDSLPPEFLALSRIRMCLLFFMSVLAAEIPDIPEPITTKSYMCVNMVIWILRYSSLLLQVIEP